MGFLRRRDNAKPDYTSLQIQTSTATLPIPILWGQNRVAPNLIWYENFQAVAGAGGKGAAGKGSVFGGSSSFVAGYTYTADVMLALCEGPVNGMVQVWKDLAIYTLPELGFGEENGTTPQAVWSYLAANYPSQALAYQGTAYVWAASYDLGSSASIGNHNFEIQGPLSGSGANHIDADPAQVIQDFLTNAQYGCGFDPASIDSGSLFTNADSFQAYCKAMGFAFSPVLVSPEQASSILGRWLQLFGTAAVWSGGLLKFIPYGDTAISAGNQTTRKTQLSVPVPTAPSSGVSLPAYVEVSDSASFVSDGGVVYAVSGVPLAFVGATIPASAGQYGMVAAGTYIFGPADQGKPVVITFTTGAQGDFVPNLTPAYELTDADFIDDSGNTDPVQVERADVFSLPTIQRIEVLSRSNQYMGLPVEARDQSQIELYGSRVGPMIQAHEICDEFTVGALVAQTLLQRALYVRTKFAFKLSWEYCLLDPMDVVTLTDANLGLSNYPVRIIDIEEDEKGLLAVTCEELVSGVSTPAYYPTATASGYQANTGVPAVSVNTPLIVQPPTNLTNGLAQIWVGASGINGGGGQQWGGANVFVSVDDATYTQVTTVTAPLRQGVLMSSIPAAAGWDATNTLAVSLAASGGLLSGTTQAAAQAGGTLSLVDSEFLAYEAAILTGPNAYDLTGLARGLGGSNPSGHSTNAPFARLDAAIAKYDLPPSLIGQTLYFKFQSYNAFGGGLQDLSTCAVYAFITSSSLANPIFAQLQAGFPVDLGEINSTPTIDDDFGTVTTVVEVAVDLGSVTVLTVHPIAAQLATGSLDLGAITSAVAVLDDFGATAADPTIDTIDLGTVP